MGQSGIAQGGIAKAESLIIVDAASPITSAPVPCLWCGQRTVFLSEPLLRRMSRRRCLQRPCMNRGQSMSCFAPPSVRSDLAFNDSLCCLLRSVPLGSSTGLINCAERYTQRFSPFIIGRAQSRSSDEHMTRIRAEGDSSLGILPEARASRCKSWRGFRR